MGSGGSGMPLGVKPTGLPPGMSGMPPGMMPGMMANPNMPNMPPILATVNAKKQRELYVGNLPTGLVTEPMLRQLFSMMIEACEGYDPAPGPPVLNAQIRTGGNSTSTFAFVEFRDEKISATVATFNGMELSGRHLKISHPNGYVEPPVPVETLQVPPELAAKFGLDSYGAMRRRDTPQEAFNDRKARELYVGNLTMGAVTGQMLIDLFTAPLGALPGLEGDGPVVQEAKVDHSGKFAFVLFRNNQLATIALSLFNKMDLCGRPLLCDRPQGYTAEMSQQLPPELLAALPPMAGQPPSPSPPSASVGYGSIGGYDSIGAVAMATGLPHTSASLVSAGWPSAAPQLPSPPEPPLHPPTRCLCLENLFTDATMSDEAELAECLEDIKEECASYGTLWSCEVPTKTALLGYAEADVGKCFVTYELISSALKAHTALNGRSFDGNTVRATFLPPPEPKPEQGQQEPETTD